MVDASTVLKGIFTVKQWYANLKSVFTVRHTATVDLKVVITVRNASSAALKAVFETAQWEDLKGIFIARQASSAALKGVFIVQHSSSANLKAVFQRKTIWGGTPQNLYAKFTVKQGTEDLYAKFETVATASLKGIFTVKQWQKDLYAKFEVRHSSSNTIYARFETQAIKDLYAKFEAQAIKDLYAKFEVTHSENLYAKFETVATAQLKGIVTVRHPDSEILRGEFRVTAEGWEMQGLTAAVYRDLSVIS